MKKIMKTSLSMLFLLLIAGCSKDDEGTSATPVATTEVYVAGYIYNSTFKTVAAVWKNGVQTLLTDGTVYAEAQDITVVGNDVYVVGYEMVNNKEVAKIWKNGVGTSLSDGLNNERAVAIAISGADIYVVGRQNNGTALIPKIWKNGTATNLPTAGSFSEFATDIYISGSDVYVSGYRNNGTESYAKIWKNGVPTNLTNGATNATVTDIVVSGTDVYAVGRDSGKGRCWKNGQVNATLVNEATSYEATNIVADGPDIYISGYQTVSGAKQLRLYKNGTAIDFQNATDDLAPSGLAINGVDNYICATKKVGSKFTALYYKNQQLVNLVPDAVVSSYATAIFVKN